MNLFIRPKSKQKMKSDEFSFYDDFLMDRFSGGESWEMVTLSELDPIEWIKENEGYCFSNEKFARLYVDAVVSEAVSQLKPKPKRYKSRDIVAPIINEMVSNAFRFGEDFVADPCREYVSSFPISSPVKNSSDGTFSGWPKISEFNIKLGLEKLEEYIESWQRSREWMCCVEFLGFESEENGNYFVYEVEFSIPTATYPIPQATASVYFSLEVSKIIPLAYDRAVEVSYVFESSNVIHYPDKVDFQENWIRDIIGSKLIFFRSVTF